MKYLFYLNLIFLVACSSLPPAISTPPAEDLQLKQVMVDIERFIGTTVRWGGKIIKVNNDENFSTVQMLQYPLNSFGTPKTKETSQGRFFSQTTKFLDPEIYKEGTLATFSGTVQSAETIQVDKKSLLLPVINIQESHIWSNRYKGQSYYYVGHHHGGRYYGYGYYPYGRYQDHYGAYGRGRYYPYYY
ncbi:hypothetical protein A9Q79_06135 [Methylophaga sp. 42_25_T18]|nr:hypothetical protein A9Q79_06135 [Methylophaga sp. 42_25_T18]OUR86700.1 hypothetical protein A9Q92_05265 [Methylophaga sp. 42_8_T64]